MTDPDPLRTTRLPERRAPKTDWLTLLLLGLVLAGSLVWWFSR